MSASVSIKVMIAKAVVVRTMPTSQDRDMTIGLVSLRGTLMLVTKLWLG
jgi:hypothetical protein